MRENVHKEQRVIRARQSNAHSTAQRCMAAQAHNHSYMHTCTRARATRTHARAQERLLLDAHPLKRVGSALVPHTLKMRNASGVPVPWCVASQSQRARTEACVHTSAPAPAPWCVASQSWCAREPARTHGSVRAHVRARTCAVVRRVSELVHTHGSVRAHVRAHRHATQPQVRTVAHEKSAGAHPSVCASTVRLCHLGFQSNTVEPFSNPFAFDSFSPERAHNCVV